MAGTRAAIRYAKAVLSLATDKQSADAVNGDMQAIANAISDNKELGEALKNEVVKAEVKKTILLQAFPNSNTITKELFNVLLENKRMELVEQVATQYSKLYNIQNGQESAVVTTAIPMTNDIEMKVLAKIKDLTNKAVTVKNVIDEDILGGFILRIGDVEYNASIQNNLNKLKREFSLN
ncbi:ATP synthase F1 subunit delta [Hanstruepera ponticola]|uniref:ATP synthase F1 subunit delta n=1 Tax=Hanstruepera ponticola TaxID=2042995 RepID=UPI000CF139C4|nr:ATP synthase F1 subunit delta [Hanstruepera ponticola]